MSAATWRVTSDATDDDAYTILARDPVWNSFALADLEPPLRAYSQFAVARREGSEDDALCLVLRHPVIGQVLSPFGSPDGVAALLAQLDLPARPLIQAQQRHLSLLEHYYRPESTWRGMLRMAVTPASLRSQATPLQVTIRQLTAADLSALVSLYALNPDSTFSAALFAEGLYIGLYGGDRLVAAAGTHALVPRHGIAVLGNIFTAPDARGQGFATAATAALVAALFERRHLLVVLNVFDDNAPAIRVYQRLGFRTHHPLVTGTARLAEPGGASVPA